KTLLGYMKDEQDIYYRMDPPTPETDKHEGAMRDGELGDGKPEFNTSQSPQTMKQDAPSQQIQGRKSGEDRPLKAMDVLHAMVAQKLKKALKDINPESTIKELVGGKSTMQNEIIGDVEKEFEGLPEKSEDIPLAELASSLDSGFSRKLGKQS